MSAAKTPLRVLITGAAGQIGYSLIPLVASGDVFGKDQPIILHLLDIEPMKTVLTGVNMEIDDCAYPLVHQVVATTNVKEAFTGVQVAVLVGGFPRKQGMDRKDLMAKNLPIFVEQGAALDQFADRNVKVLVVANPANTNCLIAALHAPTIPKKNFSALTRLDQNRAHAQVAHKLKVTVPQVNNVIIWGNHSNTMFPDVALANVTGADGKQQHVTAVVNDEKWVKEEFVPTVQKRGAAVIAARGFSSAMSAANAAADHLRDWLVTGTAPGHYVSMAVWSDGSYNTAQELIFSFPVTCKNGEYHIVKDVNLSDYAKQMLKTTEKELLDEKADALVSTK